MVVNQSNLESLNWSADVAGGGGSVFRGILGGCDYRGTDGTIWPLMNSVRVWSFVVSLTVGME